jgi:hypothetical protein
VVTRAYEEGEEQLLEDDAESKSRMYVNPLTSPQPTTSESFSSMKHSDFAGVLDGDATCSWKDLSGDEGDLWEFVSSKVSTTT